MGFGRHNDCRFDQHHGVDDLRSDSVEPHSEQPISGEEPRLAGALLPQDGYPMSQGDEFEFQRGAAANLRQEQGTEGGQKRDHMHDGMAAA